jgi:PAS domain S-box-containing protein
MDVVAGDDLLASALQTVAQPVWVVDHHGRIRFANPAAIAALGYSDAGELIGRNSHETIHHHRPDGSPYPAAECPLLRPRTTGESVTSELDFFFRRDGSMFRVSYVSAPLDTPDGRGAVVAFTDIESRLRAERELRERDETLTAQQASLQRVAALVAGGATAATVFAAIAKEVAQVVALPLVAVWRYDPGGTATVVGEWSDRPHVFRLGTSWPLDGPTVTAKVLASGRPERIENFGPVAGTIAGAARASEIGSCAGAPIIVDGRIWGAMSADKFDPAPLAEGVEERLAEFTALVATAISSSASREALVRLADEQAALRRVATLVAREASQTEVFMTIAEEVGQLLGADEVRMTRFEDDHDALVVAAWGEHPDAFAVGSRQGLDDDGVTTRVFRTGQPARLDDYGILRGKVAERVRAAGLQSVVAAPIVVEGQLWGAMAAGTTGDEPMLPETEDRLAQFTELMATTIANADARAEVARLAEEQAALRRVATLVAQGAPGGAIFDAVAAEMQRVLGADGVSLSRYEPGDEVTVVAHRGPGADHVPAGTRVRHEGENVTTLVRRSGLPARMERYEDTEGAVAELVKTLGVRASVAAPIVVNRQIWGVVIANWRRPVSPPADTEEQMARFTQLLDTAIANADSRDQLAASRARIVTEADEARRRVVRDLHDGAQQRLVHTVLTLKLAQRALGAHDGEAASLVAEALEQAERGNIELRELAHGILPPVLTRTGLRAGIGAVVARIDIPVQVDVPDERFPAEIEASAYFIVAEALTNVMKHAHAASAAVTAAARDGRLCVEVRDDGVGGANPDGHGLVGIADRVAALGGELSIESPANGGTRLAATLPIA